MTSTLVVGATGYLGRYVTAELHRRGHTIRAVVRDREYAERPGPWSSPSLKGLVDEWVVGKVTDLNLAGTLATDVEQVVSSLGVTRQKADPWDVDYRANLAILNSALSSQARSFCYINVFDGAECPAELTRAKTAFTRVLETSAITSQVINPSAFFSDMMELYKLAEFGVVPLLRPEARINPIHGADLAHFVGDVIDRGETGTWNIGGPETLTWEEIARTAFAVTQKRPCIVRIPNRVLIPILRVANLVNTALADRGRFISWNMMRDCVAPATGTRTILDFYRDNEAKERQ